MELEFLVIFHHCVSVDVELISIERNLQNWRQLQESKELFRILLTIHRSIVLIITVQVFNGYVLPYTVFNRIIALDTEIDGVEIVVLC
jgi:hypothetical protein